MKERFEKLPPTLDVGRVKHHRTKIFEGIEFHESKIIRIGPTWIDTGEWKLGRIDLNPKVAL
jgi:hypothetical protein|tara:strand:+ start:394 stop:579 length:186 start_codon:yes stop_codon:yes gene_type:complete